MRLIIAIVVLAVLVVATSCRATIHTEPATTTSTPTTVVSDEEVLEMFCQSARSAGEDGPAVREACPG